MGARQARDVERMVREHPVPICTDFLPGARACSEFWCQTCGWNRPLHADEKLRQQIAEQLRATTHATR